MSYQLYRHFDADGRLLYVGMSLSAVARLSGHKSGRAAWFNAIARVEVENFDSKQDVADAERCAIQTEYPLHNIAGMAIPQVRRPARPRQRKVAVVLTANAIYQAKWRADNPDTNRERARTGMRKKRAAEKHP